MKTWLITSLFEVTSYSDSRVWSYGFQHSHVWKCWWLQHNQVPQAAQPGTAHPALQWEEPSCPTAGTSSLPTAALPHQHGLHIGEKQKGGLTQDFQLWHVKLKVQGNGINGHWDRDETKDKQHFILLTHLVNSMDLLFVFVVSFWFFLNGK